MVWTPDVTGMSRPVSLGRRPFLQSAVRFGLEPMNPSQQDSSSLPLGKAAKMGEQQVPPGSKLLAPSRFWGSQEGSGPLTDISDDGSRWQNRMIR